MSTKTILMVVVGLAMGTMASAAEKFDLKDLDVSCDTEAAAENAVPAYDLQDGWYIPGNTASFCAVYKLTTTSHYPCNGNVRTLTLNCEGRQYGFSCQAGNCVTSDGYREIQIANGCNVRASYRSSENRTVLYYDGPCR
jgi:hypothetical protein